MTAAEMIVPRPMRWWTEIIGIPWCVRTSCHPPFSKTTGLPATCSDANVCKSPVQRGSSGYPIAGFRYHWKVLWQCLIPRRGGSEKS